MTNPNNIKEKHKEFEPFVSIIIPAYNSQHTISACLTALKRLQYPQDKFAIIVIDNNSTDKTAEIIKKFPVTYYKEIQTQSSYAARNIGIKHSKNAIIAFTDSDCLPEPYWLAEGVKGFIDGF